MDVDANVTCEQGLKLMFHCTFMIFLGSLYRISMVDPSGRTITVGYILGYIRRWILDIPALFESQRTKVLLVPSRANRHAWHGTLPCNHLMQEIYSLRVSLLGEG